MPHMGREGEDAEPGTENDGAIEGADAAQSLGRVVVGETATTEAE